MSACVCVCVCVKGRNASSGTDTHPWMTGQKMLNLHGYRAVDTPRESRHSGELPDLTNPSEWR